MIAYLIKQKKIDKGNDIHYFNDEYVNAYAIQVPMQNTWVFCAMMP